MSWNGVNRGQIQSRLLHHGTFHWVVRVKPQRSPGPFSNSITSIYFTGSFPFVLSYRLLAPFLCRLCFSLQPSYFYGLNGTTYYHFSYFNKSLCRDYVGVPSWRYSFSLVYAILKVHIMSVSSSCVVPLRASSSENVLQSKSMAAVKGAESPVISSI